MRLVKAKLKPFDQFPEWAKCCKGYKQKIAEFADTIWVIDLDTITPPKSIKGFECPFCGNIVPPHTRVETTKVYSICVELLDIDEGPVN